MWRIGRTLFFVCVAVWAVSGYAEPPSVPAESGVMPEGTGSSRPSGTTSSSDGPVRLKQRVVRDSGFGQQAPSSSAETPAKKVWKSRDAHGNVVFSDQPPEGAEDTAEQVELTSPNTMPAFRAPAGSLGRQTQSSSDGALPGSGSTQVSIVAPEQEQHFHNPVEPVAIQVSVEPLLGETETLRLLDNGEPVAEGGPEAMKLEFPDRGTHELQVQVLDAEGEVKLESDVVTIYVHRTSALHPNRQPDSPDQPSTSVLSRMLQLMAP